MKQDAADNIELAECRALLRLHVVPRLGDRPISDIRRSEVHEILDDLVASGRIGTAREVRKQMSRIFNWAADREIIESNPLAGMKRTDLAATQRRAGRSLTSSYG